MHDVIRDLIKLKKKTKVIDKLNFYLKFSDAILAIGLMSIIMGQKLEVSSYFGSDPLNITSLFSIDFWENLRIFVYDKWIDLMFSFSVIVWFFLYREAVKNEMDLLVKLYPTFKPPHDWEETIGKKWIPFLSIGITVTFLLLAYFVDHLELFCITMLTLSIFDARGNTILRQNMLRHFHDPKFIPPEDDRNKKFILERREVALDYWVWRPQIERVGLMMIGVIVAFILLSSEEVFGFEVWESVPKITIIVVIALNEITMIRWRSVRNKELDRIEDEEEKMQRDAKAGDVFVDN